MANTESKKTASGQTETAPKRKPNRTTKTSVKASAKTSAKSRSSAKTSAKSQPAKSQSAKKRRVRKKPMMATGQNPQAKVEPNPQAKVEPKPQAKVKDADYEPTIDLFVRLELTNLAVSRAKKKSKGKNKKQTFFTVINSKRFTSRLKKSDVIAFGEDYAVISPEAFKTCQSLIESFPVTCGLAVRIDGERETVPVGKPVGMRTVQYDEMLRTLRFSESRDLFMKNMKKMVIVAHESENEDEAA